MGTGRQLKTTPFVLYATLTAQSCYDDAGEEKGANMAFHCPNCNGSMVFDVASQLMRCEHCDSTCDPEDYVVHDMAVDAGDAAAQQSDMARFTCQNCGAELQGTDDSLIGFCPYCGGQSMVRSAGESTNVEYLAPFTVDKDRCMQLYADFANGVRYLPKDFKDPAFIQKFTGIYMPFVHYDIQFGQASVTGKKTVEHNSRYDIVNHYRIDAQVYEVYERGVTFDASKYLDDEISQRVQPFVVDAEKAYNPAYLAGFYADASTVDADLYVTDAQRDAADDLASAIRELESSDHGISVTDDTDAIESQVVGRHTALLPMWFLTWRKGDRVAYAVINGQSGKVVSDLPLDERAFWLGSAAISLVLFVLLELFVQPTPLLTSLMSLIATCVMCVGIRMCAKREYQKHMHANDKGWTGATDDPSTPARKKKKKERSNAHNTALGCLISIPIILLVTFFALLGSAVGPANTLRVLLPLPIIGFAVYTTVRVLLWHRQSHDHSSLVAAIVTLLVALLNSGIAIVSPVNDGIYYMGDAICILGLVIAAACMIHAYNVSTTHPLPKLFDREEV